MGHLSPAGSPVHGFITENLHKSPIPPIRLKPELLESLLLRLRHLQLEISFQFHWRSTWLTKRWRALFQGGKKTWRNRFLLPVEGSVPAEAPGHT